MIWTITLNDDQLRVVEIALESYFRTRMGQFWDLADDIAFQDRDHSDTKEWNDCYSRREAGRALFDGAYRALRPDFGMGGKKTDEMMIAEDMWRVLRHELYMRRPHEERDSWCVAADKPLNISGQPQIKLKEAEDEVQGTIATP